MSIVVDHEEIHVQAGDLADASARVDELASSIPAGVDAGLGTSAVLGILANFVTSGGQLATGLAGMSVVLDECASRYAEQDIVAADEINRDAWAE